MGLEIGIIGLPNAGKSTLFNALASRRLAETSPRPFTTINPHEAVVPVPDPNLIKLTRLIKPAKTTPATVKFIDIAGLIKGAHKGAGLGNQFLAKIREVDLLVHVINAYQESSPNEIIENYQTIRTELSLADLQTLEKISPKALHSDPNLNAVYLDLLQKLNTQTPINLNGYRPADLDIISRFFLLSIKPELVVINTTEDRLNSTLFNQTLNSFPRALALSARFAEDLIDLEESEKSDFLAEYHLSSSGVDLLITDCYQLLSLITFYTIKGGQEITARAIGEGSNALAAAALVHTDFAKSFIKAEVINVNELLKMGSWKNAKQQGKVRFEGKNYEMHNQDVVEFRVGN